MLALVMRRAGLLSALAIVVLASIDAPLVARTASARRATTSASRGASACEGARDALPDVLFYGLRTGAFPGLLHPDVAVHVPTGFDATRRPGLVLYFHGWQGCVGAAMASEDAPCSEDGGPRSSSNLARQIDESRINALLAAVEIRVDMATGEPGRLAMPGGLRDLLRELFDEHLAEPLGCKLQVDALDRVVVVAHSGGYQAAAGALALGDVPRITEVDLVDALYGADDIFLRWMKSEIARYDPRVHDGLRFVDLYTCCAGTAEGSVELARGARESLAAEGLAGVLYEDDGNQDLDPTALTHAVVFKRVPGPHSDLPRRYLRGLVEAAGFAHIEGYGSHPLRLK
jgi:hypothetical protein